MSMAIFNSYVNFVNVYQKALPGLHIPYFLRMSMLCAPGLEGPTIGDIISEKLFEDDVQNP